MNPYRIEIPAVLSLSGGRTSAFMLRNVLDAWGGKPDELEVIFANTGLEHEATYTFLHEIETRWCPVTWLEYGLDDDSPVPLLTDFAHASRNGEPYDKVIQHRGYLPTPVNRFCTAELKIRTINRYAKTIPTFADGFTKAVGLRADEPRRVARIKGDTSIEDIVCPMYDAGHTEEDVLGFWRDAPFDLLLPLTGNMAGNCVGCFLKSRGKLETLMREQPEYFDWWIAAEANAPETARCGTFRDDRLTYAEMRKVTRTQGWLPFADTGAPDLPCSCTD